MPFNPRDFLETHEGLVFAVVDPHIEGDRVLAFLRYAPQSGKLTKVGTETANRLLQADFPRYLHHSSRLQAQLHGVPLDAIHRHHRPRERVQELLRRGPADDLESKLLRLLGLLAECGVSTASLGVTGSLLIGRQTVTSDLDLVAYGRDAFSRARAAVMKAQAEGTLDVLDEAGWRDAYQRRGCSLDFEDFVRHERRKGNKGALEGTKFDLALVEECRTPDCERWDKRGALTLSARVLDAADAFGHPARYRIEHSDISEILSFTHTYVGQARDGEWIEAAGTVEESAAGLKRLIIGSSREAPGEFLRVLWPD
jgi:hypothetical protein